MQSKRILNNLPSFLKTKDCFFPLNNIKYPSIKSAISSALATENVVKTRGYKKEKHKVNLFVIGK